MKSILPGGRALRSAKALVFPVGLLALRGQAKACDEGTIDHVSPSGRYIEIDGQEYEVVSGDASGWSEGDTVQVCGDKVIDTDQDGEQVRVSQR